MKQTLAIIIVATLLIGWLHFTNKRVEALMEMCPDHETQTLYAPNADGVCER